MNERQAPPEFRLLSMTDLRTRPGEILDRVADAKESFLIERNGTAKACLVPLSVFLPDVSPSRIAQEREALEQHGERPQTSVSIHREISFRFRHAVDDDTYDLTIVLPHGYPNSCPRVYASPIEEQAPHMWADGALCIYGVMSSWNPGKHSVLTALILAKRWLNNYTAWREDGVWPIQGVEGGKEKDI